MVKRLGEIPRHTIGIVVCQNNIAVQWVCRCLVRGCKVGGILVYLGVSSRGNNLQDSFSSSVADKTKHFKKKITRQWKITNDKRPMKHVPNKPCKILDYSSAWVFVLLKDDASFLLLIDFSIHVHR